MNATVSTLPLHLLIPFQVFFGSLRVILQLFFCCSATQFAWRAALSLYHWFNILFGLFAISIAVKSSSSSCFLFFVIFIVKSLSIISSQSSHSNGSSTKSSQSSTTISMLIFCVLSVVLASQVFNDALSHC